MFQSDPPFRPSPPFEPAPSAKVEKTPAQKAAATRKRNAKAAAKVAAAQTAPAAVPEVNLETRDENFKRTVRETVRESRVGFNYNTPGEVVHALNLIGELNATGGSYKTQVSESGDRLEIWVQQ